MYNHLKLIISIFFLVFSSYILADDSLQSLYRENIRVLKTKDTVAIVKSYKYLADYLSEQNNISESNKMFKKALLLAERANLTMDVGKINNLLGNNASYEGNRQAALSYYHKALKAFVEIKNLDKVAMTMMNIGTEYEDLGDYKTAIAYELKALKNKEASGELKNLAYYYQHVGQLFKETNVTKWKYYVEKAYSISKKSDNISETTRAAIFNDLGGIAEKLNNHSEAYQWYDSMYVLSKRTNHLNGISTALSNRSVLLQSDKRYIEALRNILAALFIDKETNRTYSLITDGIHASSILLDMKRPAEAKKYAIESLKLAQEKKTYPEQEADSHRILAKINEKIGDWESAYVHLKLYHQGLDSIRGVEIQKTVHELETKFHTSEKEKKINKLDTESKLKTARLEKMSILAGGLVLVIGLVLAIVYILWRRRKVMHQKAQSELKQKLLRSQMNPHFLFNTLNAINQYIQINQGIIASDYLARYAKLMRQILENSDVEYVSLENEIEFLNNYLIMQQLRFSQSFNYEILVDDNIDTASIEIPPMIAQPFIENAIEHGLRGLSVEGKLKIEFSQKDKKLILKVTDNGKGIDVSINNTENNNHRSFAMEITRERLLVSDEKNENIQIESPLSETEAGTCITIYIPIKKYAE